LALQVCELTSIVDEVGELGTIVPHTLDISLREIDVTYATCESEESDVVCRLVCRDEIVMRTLCARCECLSESASLQIDSGDHLLTRLFDVMFGATLDRVFADIGMTADLIVRNIGHASMERSLHRS
jgi:hypothetical protein